MEEWNSGGVVEWGCGTVEGRSGWRSKGYRGEENRVKRGGPWTGTERRWEEGGEGNMEWGRRKGTKRDGERGRVGT